MSNIRKATIQDVSRIAEILVFTKRINYRSIFQNDQYSFGEMTVLSVVKELTDTPEVLDSIWVYDDSFVKGIIRIVGSEIKTLYVDSFFQNEGIGSQLVEFAIETFNVNYLWVLEKNKKAIAFYNRHNFYYGNEWQFEEGTTERLLKMIR